VRNAKEDRRGKVLQKEHCRGVPGTHPQQPEFLSSGKRLPETKRIEKKERSHGGPPKALNP